jgi:regulator of replication initiation timing
VSSALLEIADELYAMPLAEFTATRDARARELKGTDLAAPVKALRKPSLAAWVVNLLVRRDAGQVDQVLELGAALREAAAGMAGEELRSLTRQRRQLTAAVTTGARALAAGEGVKVTESVAEQVESTLTAAMLDARCAEAVRSGLLVTALSTTGLEDVDLSQAVAVPEALGFTPRPVAPAPPELHVVPDPDADEKAVAAARERVADTEQAVAAARDDVEAAARDVSELEARGMQLQGEMDELRRRLAEMEAAYEEVEEELSDAEDVRAEAEATLAAATRDHEQASAALERVSSARR